jgi:type I restriction enzyme M protein
MQKVEIVLHKVLGGGSELNYVEQTFWILSPKHLEDLEKDRATATVKIKVEVLLC